MDPGDPGERPKDEPARGAGEARSGRAASGRSNHDGDGPRRASDGPDVAELEAAVAAAMTRLRSAADAAARLARLQVDRLAVLAREGVFGAVLAAWAALVGLVVTVLASIYLLRGIAGGFAELFGGRTWAGMLAAAALVLGGTLGGVLLVRARLRKANLRNLERKYGESGANAGAGAPHGERVPPPRAG